MRYHALATDYDETLALHGQVPDEVVDALDELRRSGRRLILVTGRELPDLLAHFPRPDLFDRIVAENGGLLYSPQTKHEKPLAPPPPEALATFLRERAVIPLHTGRVLLATWEPHQDVVLEGIRTLGLEYDIIFNKGAVMVLPSGINKAFGLSAALLDLGLSPHSVVGIGDAENDHSFLRLCEAAVAVDNALPSLKKQADWVTPGARGSGVIQLIDRLIEDDLAALAPRLARHDLLIGSDSEGTEIMLPAYGENVLVAGTSGGGKSTLVTALLERVADHEYQFCIIDPEGDYETLNFAVTAGSTDIRPDLREVMEILEDPSRNITISLLAIPREDRPGFFEDLMPRLLDLRAHTGRPDWIVIDEVQHMLPTDWKPAGQSLPYDLTNVIAVAVEPQSVSPVLLSAVTLLATIGHHADRTVADFARVTGRSVPPLPPTELVRGETGLWSLEKPDRLVRVAVAAGRIERRRHTRKYAVGDMRTESFHFRGPEGKLDLPAHNLMSFLELGEGLDGDTWLYHLRRGDYSRWFREQVKDAELAEEAAAIERATLPLEESRRRIREAVERRYTLPV